MKVAGIIALIVAVLLGALANIHRHVVWQYDTTYLIWSAERVYFFANRRNEGWSGNLIELAWQFTRGAAGLSGHATDRTWWLEVTELNNDGVTRTVVRSNGPVTPAVSGGHIYATYEGALSRWEHGSFHLVGPAQATAIQQSMHGGEFTNRDGWSSYYNINNRTIGERSYPIRLSGAEMQVVVNERADRRTVTVTLPNKTAEVLLDVPTGARWVDASTYAELLKAPPGQSVESLRRIP